MEIITKFKSCFAHKPENRITFVIKNKDSGEMLAKIIMEPASQADLDRVVENPKAVVGDLLPKVIVEWDCKNGNGEMLPINGETIGQLLPEILTGLVTGFRQMNEVSKAEEKNSDRQ